MAHQQGSLGKRIQTAEGGEFDRVAKPWEGWSHLSLGTTVQPLGQEYQDSGRMVLLGDHPDPLTYRYLSQT
jgi:hypothetical protein